MKTTAILPALVAFLVAGSASAAVTNWGGALSGANEVPANASAFKGNAVCTYDDTTKTLACTITHDVTTPTMGHFHQAAKGANGAVIYAFPNVTSPITASTTLNAGQETSLKANGLYINIHTAANPGGEIRAQLEPIVVTDAGVGDATAPADATTSSSSSSSGSSSSSSSSSGSGNTSTSSSTSGGASGKTDDGGCNTSGGDSSPWGFGALAAGVAVVLGALRKRRAA